MTDPLGLFWDRCEGPIVYGVNDCCMTLADVILAAGGPDLMEPYRGRYKTRLGFVRAFRKEGHTTLPGASIAMLEAHGKPVDAPRDFDVALVMYLDGSEHVASPSFFHSGLWLLRTERGALCTEGSGTLIYRVI